MSAKFDDGKVEGALRTIGEVSKALGIKSHVLRYWEEKFPMLEPLKRSGSRRYYREDDIQIIERIDDLVNQRGYTLKGARKVIEDGAAQDAAAQTSKAQAGKAQASKAQASKAQASKIRDIAEQESVGQDIAASSFPQLKNDASGAGTGPAPVNNTGAGDDALSPLAHSSSSDRAEAPVADNGGLANFFGQPATQPVDSDSAAMGSVAVQDQTQDQTPTNTAGDPQCADRQNTDAQNSDAQNTDAQNTYASGTHAQSSGAQLTDRDIYTRLLAIRNGLSCALDT